MKKYRKPLFSGVQICLPLLFINALASANPLNQSHSRLAAAIGEQDTSFHAAPHARGLRMSTNNGSLSAEFTGAGVVFAHRDHRWGIALRGYGYGKSMRAGAATQPQAKRNRVEYRRGDMTEWYINGPIGIEQGFTISAPPGRAAGEPLTLAFTVSPSLVPAVDADGRGLMLRERSQGAPAIRYAGLTAWDASGRTLRSWLEAAGNELRLQVEDAGAQYPITIDPYVQAGALTTRKPCSFGSSCDDGREFGYFGLSVAMSGDGKTAVVGGAGSAYVFVRPGVAQGGWGSPTPIYYAAKLVPADSGTARARFGQSVGIDGTGTNIVVGSPAGPEQSRLYVYTKPATGWGNGNPLTQTAMLWNGTVLNENLGMSVAMSADGKTIVTGAPNAVAGWGQGAAYIYRASSLGFGWLGNGSPSRMYLDTPYWVPGNNFGEAVSVNADGTVFLVGSTNQNELSRGKAYIFHDWGYTPLAILHSSDSNMGKFGATVSLSADGNTAVVGASGCVRVINCEANPYGGNAAYVYVKPGQYWSDAPRDRYENAKLIPSNPPTSSDYFAAGVTTNSDGSVVAVAMANAVQGGSVYVYNRRSTGWANAYETSKYVPTDTPYSLSINGDGTTILSGSPKAVVGNQVYHGISYVSVGPAQIPQISFSPAYLTFAPQPVGTTSAPQQVIVKNVGNAPLNVSSVGASNGFTTTQSCAAASPIAPGATCTETVTFRPMAVGAYNGTVMFTSDHAGTPGTLSAVWVQGEGAKAATVTSVTSASPNPVLRGAPMTIAYSVAPQGTASVVPTGTVTVKASTGETCTGTAPSGSCVLTFATAVNRTVTATYSGDANFVASTSANASAGVVDFAVAVSPSSQTTTGRKATYTVTVSGVNGFSGAVALTCNGGPANTTCAMSPTSVAVSVAAATSKVTYTVAPNAPTGSYTVGVSGQASGVTRSASATVVVK